MRRGWMKHPCLLLAVIVLAGLFPPLGMAQTDTGIGFLRDERASRFWLGEEDAAPPAWLASAFLDVVRSPNDGVLEAAYTEFSANLATRISNTDAPVELALEVGAERYIAYVYESERGMMGMPELGIITIARSGSIVISLDMQISWMTPPESNLSNMRVVLQSSLEGLVAGLLSDSAPYEEPMKWPDGWFFGIWDAIPEPTVHPINGARVVSTGDDYAYEALASADGVSADAALIAYIDETGQISIMDSDFTNIVSITAPFAEVNQESFDALSWSHDGSMLVFGNEHGFWIYRDGGVEALPNTQGCLFPTFNAENTRVLYSCLPEGGAMTGLVSSSSLDGSDQRDDIERKAELAEIVVYGIVVRPSNGHTAVFTADEDVWTGQRFNAMKMRVFDASFTLVSTADGPTDGDGELTGMMSPRLSYFDESIILSTVNTDSVHFGFAAVRMDWDGKVVGTLYDPIPYRSGEVVGTTPITESLDGEYILIGAWPGDKPDRYNTIRMITARTQHSIHPVWAVHPTIQPMPVDIAGS